VYAILFCCGIDSYCDGVQGFAVSYLDMLHLKCYVRSGSRSRSGSALLHTIFVAVSLAQNLGGTKIRPLLSLPESEHVHVEAGVRYVHRVHRVVSQAFDHAEPRLIFDGQARQNATDPHGL
jgi:hypothetical protein